jgi:hypothetical protein
MRGPINYVSITLNVQHQGRMIESRNLTLAQRCFLALFINHWDPHLTEQLCLPQTSRWSIEIYDSFHRPPRQL